MPDDHNPYVGFIFSMDLPTDYPVRRKGDENSPPSHTESYLEPEDMGGQKRYPFQYGDIVAAYERYPVGYYPDGSWYRGEQL